MNHDLHGPLAEAGSTDHTGDTGHAGPDLRHGPGPHLMGSATLVGNKVCNMAGQSLGDIEDIMIDMRSGRVSYAVLAFGSFMGMGGKLFAVPWAALTLDTEHKRFALDVDRERLESAPGFDKLNWPDMADPTWQAGIDRYYAMPATGGAPQGAGRTR